jgi:DNA primase large subunit
MAQSLRRIDRLEDEKRELEHFTHRKLPRLKKEWIVRLASLLLPLLWQKEQTVLEDGHVEVATVSKEILGRVYWQSRTSITKKLCSKMS